MLYSIIVIFQPRPISRSMLHRVKFSLMYLEIEYHIIPLIQVYVLNPKQDLHGLGYDPYKNAPEFRGMYFLT